MQKLPYSHEINTFWGGISIHRWKTVLLLQQCTSQKIKLTVYCHFFGNFTYIPQNTPCMWILTLLRRASMYLRSHTYLSTHPALQEEHWELISAGGTLDGNDEGGALSWYHMRNAGLASVKGTLGWYPPREYWTDICGRSMALISTVGVEYWTDIWRISVQSTRAGAVSWYSCETDGRKL